MADALGLDPTSPTPEYEFESRPSDHFRLSSNRIRAPAF